MTFELIKNILQGLIVFQSLFFTFFLIFNKKGKRKSNFILSGFTLTLGFHFLNLILADYTTFFIPKVNTCFLLLYAPLIFLYCKSYLNDAFVFSNKHFYHLLPIGYVIVWNLFLSKDFSDKGIFYNLITIPIYIQLITYLVLSLKLINVKSENASGYSLADLSWLKFIIITFLSTILLYLSVLLFKISSNQFLVQATTIVFLIIMVILVNGFVFKALSEPELFRFNDLKGSVTDLNTIKNESSKYSYSSLDEKESEKKMEELLKYMEKKNPYINSLITLPKLAKDIPMDARHLSQIINDKLGKNFYDFINEYRIKKAVRILEDIKSNNIKINDLMYLVGFNSKSTFNTAFKKVTGKTPSQLKKEVSSKI